MSSPEAPRTYQWHGGGELSPDEAGMVRRVEELLADGRARSVEELLDDDELRRAATTVDGVEGSLDDDQAPGYLDEVLEHVDADLGWIVDDRWFLRSTVRMVCTVRVTEDLLASGEVVDGPDLSPLAATGLRAFPVGGATARRVLPADEAGPDAYRFVLPRDALPSDTAVGDLLALSWDGDELTVQLVDEPDDAAVGGAAATLRTAYDALVEAAHEDTVDDVDVVLVARLDHGLFTTPVLPVTELLPPAGLARFGDVIAEADHDWSHWGGGGDLPDLVNQVAGILAEEHDLDPEESATLLALLGAVDAEVADLGLTDEDEDEAMAPAPDAALPLLLDACRNERVAEAVAFECAYDVPERAEGLAVLARRMLGAARGRDRVVPLHLLACVATAQRDPEQAAAHARRAVQADPQFAPAAHLASRYASLRGDAATALRHLTAVWDLGPGDVAGDLLRRYARPGPTDAPRNAPCPCGSGRKHKVCCAPRNGWPLSERVQWLLLKARDHVTSEVRMEELMDFVEVLAGDLEGEVRVRTSQGAVGNAFVQGLLLWEGGVLADFLDVHAALLPADELDLGRRWLDAGLDLWEVTEVRPGEGLSLLGLYRGETVEVREAALTETATVGSTYLARVLDADDHLELPSVWPVDLHLREHLLTEVFPHDPSAYEWAAVLAPRRQLVANHDGDELVLHTTTYAFDVGTELVADALHMMGLDEVDGTWSWIHPDDPRRVVRGFLELDGDHLVVTTNSDQRQAELDAGLREVFDDAIAESAHTSQTMEEARERVARDGAPPLQDPATLPPEVRAAVQGMIEQAERDWVDESVPALGGLTPREALQDPTRRADLLALLDEFDRHEVPAGMGFDTDNLRRHLGLL